MINCPHCESNNVKKFGIYHGKQGEKRQRYGCLGCKDNKIRENPWTFYEEQNIELITDNWSQQAVDKLRNQIMIDWNILSHKEDTEYTKYIKILPIRDVLRMEINDIDNLRLIPNSAGIYIVKKI